MPGRLVVRPPRTSLGPDGQATVTADERKRFEEAMSMVYDIRADIAALIQKVDNLIELRNVNNILTKSHFDAFEQRCAERHGNTVQRVEHLEKSERRSFKRESMLQGMIAPAAVFVAIVALLVNLLT